MAFSKGQESTEGVQIKRYVGVASSYVLAVNPSKEELEKHFGRELENAPVYVSEAEVNGKKVPQVKIDFLIQADPAKYKDAEGSALDLKTRVTFFLRRAGRTSSAGKWQIIDKYGRTAWATEEEIQQHKVPVYGNGKPANIDSAYRKAYDGEESLIKFLIAYLGIQAPATYVNGEWVTNDADKLADSEASLEHIEDYFKGDVSELRSIIALQPNNKVKVCYGVRKADDGREFQTTYTRMFLKNRATNYSKLDEDIQKAKNAGAMPTVEFDTTELHEFVVTPTTFEEPATADLPFDTASTPWG